MAKDICRWNDPTGHPREADSPYTAYCRKCGKERQRRQSRDQLSPEQRRSALYQRNGDIGDCQVCSEEAFLTLVLTVEEDQTVEWCIEWGRGDPFALVCRSCLVALMALSPETFQRMQKWWLFLRTQSTEREQIVPELDRMTLQVVDLRQELPEPHTKE